MTEMIMVSLFADPVQLAVKSELELRYLQNLRTDGDVGSFAA